jgi:uncharacterized protein
MIQMAVFNLLIGTFVLLLTRGAHPALWSRRWVRRIFYGIWIAGPLGALCRGVGVGLVVKTWSDPYLAALGAFLSGGGTVLLLSLFVAMPLATLMRLVFAGVERVAALRTGPRREGGARAAPVDDPTPARIAEVEAQLSLSVPRPLALPRRQFVEGAVAAVPALFTGTAAIGIGGAFVDTAVPRRRLAYAGLPPALDGLRILQISDLHLGAFITRSGVTSLVARARDARPDLVVLTGDICDHLPWLEFALREFETIEAPLGHFAVMGNHEYYRGARATRALYARSQVRMLDDEHVVLERGGAKILLAGVDDPAGWDHAKNHYDVRADAALASAPSDADFRLALCHRPKGFAALAARGVDLTLSGHTHGAQAGLAGRSLLEPVLPDWHLWGEYRRGTSALYTSSGAGHWATFRLGCPSEAPLIELARVEEAP